MQPDEPLSSWLDQMASERKARVERRAAERAHQAIRRRHGVDARNARKVRRLRSRDPLTSEVPAVPPVPDNARTASGAIPVPANREKETLDDDKLHD